MTGMDETQQCETGRAARVAALNDRFRAQIGTPVFGKPDVPGTVFMTCGISALPPEVQIDLWFKVREFSRFPEGDDPWGERDFGALDLAGKKIFWKIDYYADARMEHGAEDPADPARSYRVLTLLLGEEW